MPECPTPWKRGYDERWAALAARTIGSQSAYQCGCGKWHVKGHARKANGFR